MAGLSRGKTVNDIMHTPGWLTQFHNDIYRSNSNATNPRIQDFLDGVARRLMAAESHNPGNVVAAVLSEVEQIRSQLNPAY